MQAGGQQRLPEAAATAAEVAAAVRPRTSPGTLHSFGGGARLLLLLRSGDHILHSSAAYPDSPSAPGWLRLADQTVGR